LDKKTILNFIKNKKIQNSMTQLPVSHVSTLFYFQTQKRRCPSKNPFHKIEVGSDGVAQGVLSCELVATEVGATPILVHANKDLVEVQLQVLLEGQEDDSMDVFALQGPPVVVNGNRLTQGHVAPRNVAHHPDEPLRVIVRRHIQVDHHQRVELLRVGLVPDDRPVENLVDHYRNARLDVDVAGIEHGDHFRGLAGQQSRDNMVLLELRDQSLHWTDLLATHQHGEEISKF